VPRPFKIQCLATIALLCAACLTACSRSSTADSTTAAPTGNSAAAGSIVGRVTLAGGASLPQILPGSPNLFDESLMVHSGNLKNVIVYLKDAPPSTFSKHDPVVLDQIHTQYVPHVIALQTTQPLRLKSSDNMLHNVHLQCSVNPDQNYGFSKPGTRDITLDKPEPPFAIKCDVHPWMSAYAAVFSHPWFAVTDSDGTFTIAAVPPGHYTLVAWQEVLPPQEISVDVTADQSTTANFTFAAP